MLNMVEITEVTEVEKLFKNITADDVISLLIDFFFFEQRSCKISWPLVHNRPRHQLRRKKSVRCDPI